MLIGVITSYPISHFIRPFRGIITPFITGRGPSCRWQRCFFWDGPSYDVVSYDFTVQLFHGWAWRGLNKHPVLVTSTGKTLGSRHQVMFCHDLSLQNAKSNKLYHGKRSKSHEHHEPVDFFWVIYLSTI